MGIMSAADAFVAGILFALAIFVLAIAALLWMLFCWVQDQRREDERDARELSAFSDHAERH